MTSNININVPLEDHELPEAQTLFKEGVELATVVIDRLNKPDERELWVARLSTGRVLFYASSHDDIHARVDAYMDLFGRVMDRNPQFLDKFREANDDNSNKLETPVFNGRRVDHSGPCCRCVSSGQSTEISSPGSN